MPLASDITIRRLALENQMIHPFVATNVNKSFDCKGKAISYGLSSFGYDVRIKDELLVFKLSIWQRIKKFFGCLKPIDPKLFDKNVLKKAKIAPNGAFILPAYSYALASTPEYFKIPKNITPLCFTKSTYARSGVVIAPTVMEAGWEGEIVIEIKNETCYDVLIYPYEGIAQLIFGIGDMVCETSYSDRNGKYQNQTGITLPK